MQIKNYLDLVCSALPYKINIDEFVALSPHSMWINDPYQAAENAFRNCKYIDWEMYIHNNKDVADVNIDPIIHFIHHGIFECRKLYYKNIDISIIVPNYNNGFFLRYGLKTLINQSLSNIEIIVIDDSSNDNSIHIINQYQALDKRVKLISLSSNQSQHMARKYGVEVANGKYIMFMDSDDYYMPYTCETAYRFIKDDYDIVAFNTKVIPTPYVNSEEDNKLELWINRGNEGIYDTKEILDAMFIQRSLNFSIWNKIYKTDIVKNAFANLENGFFPRGQDIYEGIAMYSKAKNLLKIKNYLYCYRANVGVSFPDYNEKNKKLTIYLGDMVKPITKLLNNNNLQSYHDYIINPYFLQNSIKSWVADDLNESDMTYFFNKMADDYGIVNLVSTIAEYYYNDIEKIAEIFKYYQNNFTTLNQIKCIGIEYRVLVNGGAENMILKFCDVLVENGYKVILFLREKNLNDIRINPKVSLYYLKPFNYTSSGIRTHLHEMYEVLSDIHVDIMISHEAWYPCLIWEILLLSYMNIPLFMFQHSDFNHRLVLKEEYDLQKLDSVLRCVTQVFCLSKYSELYYRIRGINAQVIHNPITVIQNFIDFDKIKNTIVFVGRLDAPEKQILQSFIILSEVKKELPKIKMILVGNIKDRKNKEIIEQEIDRLEIRNNVEFVGWVDNPGKYINDAAILLSTSYTEGFPLAISEAHGRGVPAVIYDLPITLKDYSASIIAVPQGDYKGAAQEIINILTNRELWEQLSYNCINIAKEFSEEKYINIILERIENFNKYSNFHFYKQKDYSNVIKYLSYYANRKTIN